MGIKNLGRFTTALDQVAAEIPWAANRFKRKLALKIDTILVTATPVDEGTARRNWLPSIGSARTEIVKPEPSGEDGSSGTANGQAAINEMLKTTASVKSSETIFITNNLSYIVKLNDGHSPQADTGFIESAVQLGVETTKP